MLARSIKLTARSLAGLALAGITSFAALAEDEVRMIEPKWDDPAVKSYFENTPRASAEAAGPRDEIKLPVLELKEPPASVQGGMRAAAEATSEPEIIYDPNNPVWYQVTHDYGDVTVTIEADLRVRTAAPDTQIFEKEGRVETEGPEVSIYADAEDEGAPGFVAEYTVEKFGVPYTVRVECTAAVKEECADKAKVAATEALLTIKGGNPPAPKQ